MKSKFKRALAFTAAIAMCGMTLLQFPSGTFYLPLPASAAEGDACTYTDCTGTFDANGFCTEGGTHYEPAAYIDDDDVYEIANAGQLYWFMELVNSVELDENEKGYADYDAVLTADITVNENVLNEDGTLAEGDFREWFPIGYQHNRNGDNTVEAVSYTGTFDGQGNTISGLYFNDTEQSWVGLFGLTAPDAVIRNVIVSDSYFYGGHNIGGICGSTTRSTIENCVNQSTIKGTSRIGGICAYNGGLLTNCLNSGSIIGDSIVGGIAGYSDGFGGNSIIANCYSNGTITGSTETGGVCGENYHGAMANCYYDSTVYTGDAVGYEPFTTKKPNVGGKTSEQFQSGEVAYLLRQGCTVGEKFYSGEIWGQKLGVQDYPVPNGMPVYYGYKDCYSTQKTYNNVKKDSPSHDFVNGTCVYCGNTPSCVHPGYENGFCLACDTYEPAVLNDNDTAEDTTDDFYEIANAGQLYWFMEYVNAGNTETDAILTADITVNENVLKADGTLAEGDFRAWFPIGYYYDRDGDDDWEYVYYNGTFDGQDHTISGLYFDNAEQDFVGLFGQTNSDAEICNVTVADSYFKGKNDVGGVCGMNDSGTITNSTNSGSVNGSDYVGGVCGMNDSGTITNSTNSGNVTGTDSVGGVCGFNSHGTITDCTNSGSVTGNIHVGGVCGYNSSGTITNSTNSGNVTGTDSVGGVCGMNDSGTITNSTNSGSVTGNIHVGGVCGMNDSGTITNSTNSGNVTGTDCVGGVCGFNSSGTITDCTNSSSVDGSDYVGGVCGFNSYGTITNSTNSGNVTGTDSVGGVCGCNYGAITNCYYDSTVFTGNAVGDENSTATNAPGKTTEEFKSGEVAYLLQSAQTETDENGDVLHVWGQTIGEDTYPVLGGDKVYQCESECSGTFYSNTEGEAQAHAYVNGFCTNTNCKDGYQPASDTDNNGVYEIANAGQLYWFMEYVNANTLLSGGDTEDTSDDVYTSSSDAILTANITVNENVLNEDGTLAEGDFRAWFPIGYYYDRDGDSNKEDIYYNGTFDGQGYTISGLYFDNAAQEYVGLFGQTKSGAEICNVTVEDSYFKGRDYVGGVCGYSYGTITNSTNCGSVEGVECVGGVCGYSFFGTITNSTNSGSVTGNVDVGGVCGYNYSGTITDCTNSGSVAGESSVGGVCGYNSYAGTIKNCYYDSTVFTGNAVGYENSTATNALGKTTEEFKSGEVAYLLQSAQTETDEEGNILHVWGQTIGEDTHPVLGGDEVYQCESECSGTFYSNTEGDVQAHAYVNGFCTNADCKYPYQPATDTDENGVYEIANAGQLYWFMELVNSVELDEIGIGYADYDAILTANITVNENVLKADGTLNGDGSNFREWFPIGYYYVRDGVSSIEDVCYNGAFDGQGYTISGLYFDNAEQDYVGLFGQINSSAEICNVTVADSYFKGSNYVGGVCGNNSSGTITNSTNSGSVTGNAQVGGVCGYNFYGTITNCYYDSDVFTRDAVGVDEGATTSTLGKTTAEFQSGEVAYLLQSAQTETDEEGNILHVWGQTIGENTYPVLGGNKVYKCTSECGGTFYSNTEGDVQAHIYVNGFCMNADCEDPYQPATDTDEDGVYEIANGGQLYWFMELVNSVEPDESGNRYADYDAVLTADITVNKNVLNEDGTLAEGDFRAWFPIGYCYDRDGDGSEESICYNGTFDGQGYTISGLYFDNENQSYVGLFGQINTGAVIRNVHVVDTYFNGYVSVGGVCGMNYSGTFTNCSVAGSISGNGNVGGVCGYNDGTITNCYAAGSVSDTAYVGGVCGNNAGTITNCHFDSTVFDGDAVGYEDGTATDVLGKTTAEFQSGEVAYLLQSAQTETDEEGNILHVWGQTIGEDTYPVLGGDKVYKCTSKCSGTFYSNTEGDVQVHAYVNGFCMNADCENPYQPATDTNEDGVYEIANAGQLYWFMEL